MDESSIFMLKLLELEVDRIRFVLRGYLRARMCKIQRFHMHLLSDSSEMARMSEQEAKVCRAYTDAIAEHHNSSFIGNIPENLQGLHSDEMIARPDMDAHVFIRVLRDVGAIEADRRPAPASSWTALPRWRAYAAVELHDAGEGWISWLPDVSEGWLLCRWRARMWSCSRTRLFWSTTRTCKVWWRAATQPWCRRPAHMWAWRPATPPPVQWCLARCQCSATRAMMVCHRRRMVAILVPRA